MKKKILIVEGDLAGQAAFHYELSQRGHEVDVTTDAAEAVEWASRRLYDLVIVDMAVASVAEGCLCRKLQTAHALGQPALLLTAEAACLKGKVSGGALDRGDAVFLRRPFDLKELLARVEEALRGSVNSELQRLFREMEAAAGPAGGFEENLRPV
jgi:DNA-binding response OmpR family regulator